MRAVVRPGRLAAGGVVGPMSGICCGTEKRLGDGRTVVLAEPRRRFVARLVDLVLLAPAMLLYVGSFFAIGFCSLGQALTTLGGGEPDFEACDPAFVALWAGLLVLVLYEPVMVARWGATVGKAVMGIRVVSSADGGRVSHGRSWARVLLPTAAGVLTLGVGWFVVWFVLALPLKTGRDHSGLHDRLVGTVVVRAASAGPDEGLELSGSARAGVKARVRAGTVDAALSAPLVVGGGVWLVLAAMEGYGLHHVERGAVTYADVLGRTAVYWVPPVAMAALAAVVCGPVVASCWGATAGQRVARIRVVRFDGGGLVGLGGAVLRWAVAAMPLGVGVAALMWALWDGTDGVPGLWLAVVSLGAWVLMHASALWGTDRRGWRDKLTGTMVVQVGRERSGRRGPGDEGFDRWQRFMHGAERDA